ncbi:MAG: hypothetical protein SF182_03280 [Deltaproteobacteria bacterium]|nr:hypothetical protein [Deltaproteobacteria bacterium]
MDLALAALLMLALSATTVHAQVTDENVDAAVASAKTAADHEALATYFSGKSKQALANVEMHKKMAGAFSGKAASSWEAHCNSLIKSFQQQSEDYASLAKEQAALAKGMSH